LNREIYVSIDIEADGPIPGLNSMLSLGAAAFSISQDRRTWSQVGTFQANLKQLPEATPNPETMKWWATQPEAWAKATEQSEDPAVVMPRFVDWVKSLPGKPVLAGYPITYDFLFVYWYTVKFTGFPAPFGFSGLDIKTLAMDRLGCNFREATKRKMPKSWFLGSPPHTHQALDDAIGQGVLLMNLLRKE
jgi:hypothetical protein